MPASRSCSPSRLRCSEQFGPTTNLTEIRDRMVGILLGVGVATFVQMSFWREGEGDVLRQKLATMLRTIAAQLRAPQAGADARDALPHAQRQLQAWAALADCEATLSRVALEPGWQEGEQEQLTLRAQTVLAQGREIMLAGDALRIPLAAQAGSVERTNGRRRALGTGTGVRRARASTRMRLRPTRPMRCMPRRIEIAAQAERSRPTARSLPQRTNCPGKSRGCRIGAPRHPSRHLHHRPYEHEGANGCARLALASRLAMRRVDGVRAAGLRTDPSRRHALYRDRARADQSRERHPSRARWLARCALVDALSGCRSSMR